MDENGSDKILWNFSVQTDRGIEARRPDLIIIDKENNKHQIIDFAVPSDTSVFAKETEKIEEKKKK